MLSRRGLVEFGKGCVKLVVIGLVLFVLLKVEVQGVADAMFLEPVTVPDLMLRIVVRLLAGVAIAFALITASPWCGAASPGPSG